MSRVASIYGRTPGTVSASAGYRLVKTNPSVTFGNDRNRDTAGTFNRLTEYFILSKLFYLESILWDIRTAGNYTISFVDSGASSPTALYTIATDMALSGSNAENTITLSPGILLTPGYYYLSAYNASTVGWTDYGTAGVASAPYAYFLATYYGGVSYSFTAPFKLVGYVCEIQGLNNFMPANV